MYRPRTSKSVIQAPRRSTIQLVSSVLPLKTNFKSRHQRSISCTPPLKKTNQKIAAICNGDKIEKMDVTVNGLTWSPSDMNLSSTTGYNDPDGNHSCVKAAANGTKPWGSQE